MEKIFNFFRFTNQIFFETYRTVLSLTVVNSDGRLTKLQVFTNSTGAELIANALVEFSELYENDYRGHQLINVRSGKAINYNTSMVEAGVVDNGKLHCIYNTNDRL